MTPDELDALPDATIGFGQRIEERDGQRVVIPFVVEGPQGAMWHGPDDPILIADEKGRVWSVGWIDGVRYKRRRHEYESLDARLS